MRYLLNMDRKVTVLTPNGRRHQVIVTNDTTLLQVLEETCAKYNLDADSFCLKFHNKDVSLSQMFRFSGLPNNCLLEMSPVAQKRILSPVDICIQFADGERMQGQFLPTDNVYHVFEVLNLEKLKSYENPVVIYMRHEIIGLESMQEKTLKSLGIISGRAILRIVNKTPEQFNTQANVYIPPVEKDEDELKKPQEEIKKPKTENATTTSAAAADGKPKESGNFSVTKALIKSLKKDKQQADEKTAAQDENVRKLAANNKTESRIYDWGTGPGRTIKSSETLTAAQSRLSSAQAEDTEMLLHEEASVNIIGERSAVIFSLDHIKKKQEIEPDSFFELTVQDLQMVLRDLRKTATGDEDAPLLTARLRELEMNKTMLNKIAQYKSCIIRIQFPDRYVIQGVFKPIDYIEDVKEFVKTFIINTDVNFYLFTIPPKKIVESGKTLLELDFVPTAVLHFAYENHEGIDKTQSFLKSELLTQLTKPESAFGWAYKLRKDRKIKHEENNILQKEAKAKDRAKDEETFKEIQALTQVVQDEEEEEEEKQTRVEQQRQ